jgi:hypothetical protein
LCSFMSNKTTRCPAWLHPDKQFPTDQTLALQKRNMRHFSTKAQKTMSLAAQIKTNFQRLKILQYWAKKSDFSS